MNLFTERGPTYSISRSRILSLTTLVTRSSRDVQVMMMNGKVEITGVFQVHVGLFSKSTGKYFTLMGKAPKFFSPAITHGIDHLQR